ncbi:lytic transglycosylase domain-containing protein [bacterium]|nr:lytic transglycosylase domain-containing protein [bacterium]
MIRKLTTLILGMTMFLLSNQANATSNIPKVTVKEYIVKHSIEMGVDPALALSIAKLESGFCHEKKSPYGAVGVFQLMPSTAKKLGFNPYYVNENIKGGLMYYKMMYQKFGSTELALAAYNAGPGNVSKYNGMPPFKETKYFVSTIMAEYDKQKSNPDPIIHQVKSQNKKQETQKIQEAKTTVKTEKENTPKQTPVAKDVLSMFVGLETNSIE